MGGSARVLVARTTASRVRLTAAAELPKRCTAGDYGAGYGNGVRVWRGKGAERDVDGWRWHRKFQ
jgi:hypothetical protein